MTASPCRNVCLLDAAGKLYLGCGRTLEEIAGWTSMTDEQRRLVMRRLHAAPDQLQPTQ